MNDKTTAPSRQFQADIYRDLDQRLKDSRWNSGASEAHGVLSGLACRGVHGDRVRGKAWLLQWSEEAEIDLLEGMYRLILRDLQSDSFEYALLLPERDSGAARRLEALADWCAGFMLGFLHDGDERLESMPAEVQESVNDIIEISRVGGDAGGDEEIERQAVELEEYLRVATQLIFEELNPQGVGGA